MKFGVSVRTLDTLPALNFVKKNRSGDLSLGEIFTKNSKFSRFYFYTDNVKISLKRTDRFRNQKNIFLQNRSRGLPVLHCLREVMHIDF